MNCEALRTDIYHMRCIWSRECQAVHSGDGRLGKRCHKSEKTISKQVRHLLFEVADGEIAPIIALRDPGDVWKWICTVTPFWRMALGLVLNFHEKDLPSVDGHSI